ncbi:thioredoxin family protein [Bacillus thuringiensis]
MKKKLYLTGFAITTLAIVLLIVLFVNNKPANVREKTAPQEQQKQKDPQVPTDNELSNNNLHDLVASNKDVFVYFYQPKCHYCVEASKVLKPIVVSENMKLYQFDLSKEENMENWEKYAIKGTPTIIKFKDGKEISRLQGFGSNDDYKSFLKQKM